MGFPSAQRVEAALFVNGVFFVFLSRHHHHHHQLFFLFQQSSHIATNNFTSSRISLLLLLPNSTMSFFLFLSLSSRVVNDEKLALRLLCCVLYLWGKSER